MHKFQVRNAIRIGGEIGQRGGGLNANSNARRKADEGLFRFCTQSLVA